MRAQVVFLCLGLALGSSLRDPPQKKSYKGYQVLEVVPNTKDDVILLKNWMLTVNELDFWEAPKDVDRPVVLLVPPSRLHWVRSQAQNKDMTVTVKNNNIQGEIEEESKQLEAKLRQGMAYDPTNFNTYDDIMAEMANLAANNCPSGFFCDVYSVGQSYEGRALNVLRVYRSGNRYIHWIDGGIHAREWITPATTMTIADRMMKNYGSDPMVTELLDGYDWYFLPVMNPDGYVYTWTSDRYWRKNRRPGGGCYGADLNRNYDFRWGTDGVSHNPCSDLYCGPSGGSEPETQAVQNEANRLGHRIVSWNTIHSYGNMFMHPWGNTIDGWTCQRATDHADMFNVARDAANAIMATYNTRWTYGTSCEVIYETSGGTDDYVKGVSGVKYAFCPELRGSGFVINRNQIAPSANEMFNGIYAMAIKIREQEGT